MNEARPRVEPNLAGIQIHGATERDIDTAHDRFMADLAAIGLDRYVSSSRARGSDGPSVRFRLNDALARHWAPDSDTTQLCQALDLDTDTRPGDLEREIIVAMLLAPVAFTFPSHEELVSAIRIRKFIVQGARKTALAFDTEHAERPECWTYSEASGFTLRPGEPLIASLEKATQPGRSGKLYSFSCYRATEYVILLAIAQELAVSNPDLMQRLQHQWETRAIMSGQFHDVFLREYGSMSQPLPKKYFVPGDRLWFRNPDEHSANVEGYEGSWVFYLGDGLFTNFWKQNQPFTLTSKCLELFHWRNATCLNGDGKLQIDEDIVEERVRQSLQDPVESAEILRQMLRLREPTGVYIDGGCLDSTREYARWVRPGTADMALPDALLVSDPDQPA